mgnify:CR=1 FL=1|jgi:hypothetical protein
MKKKLILLIQNDPMHAEMLAETYRKYPEFEVVIAIGATAGLAELRKRFPDVLILERVISYGDVKAELRGEYDYKEWDAGYLLLEKMLKMLGKVKKADRPKVSIFISGFTGMLDMPATAEQLALLQCIDATILRLPYDTLRLEYDVCQFLGVETRIPAPLLEVILEEK